MYGTPCSPAHPQNSRGYIADLQIVDEAGFVPSKLFMECVLPVGLSNHVTTVLATTPGPEDSWFMQAIKLVREDNGEALIPLKRAYEPCDMHRKTRTPQICMCRANQRASWKNPLRERAWAPLWFSRQDTFHAENLGIEIVSNNQAFHPDAIARFRTRPRMEIKETVKYIFIAIDPAGGGQDEYSIVAAASVGGASLTVCARRMVSLTRCGMRVISGQCSGRSSTSGWFV